MKKIRFHHIWMSIFLVVAALLAIYALYPSPPERAVKQFLDYLLTGDKRFYGFLEKHIDKTHPFLKLALEQAPFKDFKIVESKSTAKGVNRVMALLNLEQGYIRVSFAVAQTNGKWYIQDLPSVIHFSDAIPVIENGSNRRSTEVLLHIAEDRLLCTNPLPSNRVQNLTPSEIILVENQIVYINPLKPVKLSKIMAASRLGRYIEDSCLGRIPTVGDIPVYSIEGNSISYQGILSGLIGYTDSTLFCDDDGVGRTVIVQDQVIPRDGIRVLIRNKEDNGVFHKQVSITCNTGFTAETLIQPISHTFKAGEVITLKPDAEGMALYLNGQKLASTPNRWYIRPLEGGRLSILNNGGSSPKKLSLPYRGTLEIALGDDHNDGLIVVNELSLEEYLYTVVPSEMPIKFGLEALKVQAIASRSYAIRCFKSEGYAAFGAHVDDSTASQVYNSIAEQPIAIQAVDETRGLVGFFGDQVVDARFFSTSCGYTANFHEVWDDKNDRFPSQEVPYLTAKPQFPSNVPNLHNEENFRAFIDQKNLDGYDRFSPFFRWSVTMKRQELEASIQHNLPLVQRSEPAFVLTRQGESEFTQQEIPQDIGELQNLVVTRRGQGGNMMELEITTTRGVFKVIKEYNIRRVLQPVNYLDSTRPIKLYCHDGSVRDNFPILPSAFAYIDIKRNSEGIIEEVTITGGGYGHGVGMSQYGAYGMSLMGYSFEQIFQHFYPGCQLKNIYED
ncbi:MAG: SpoIID/LytB domain-containing protein [Caldicoprobacter sp.]|uniref:SpoIID/LytB domain-containing protein n=1 Tax=Caldicoprobacter sp. TaxID=2004500 RepID=UPI0039C41E0D